MSPYSQEKPSTHSAVSEPAEVTAPVWEHLRARLTRGVGVDPDGADDGRHSHGSLEAAPDDESGDKGWVSDGDPCSSLTLPGWFLSVHVLLHVPI